METPRQVDLFTGVFVPRIVLEDDRLTAPARILFGVLDGLAKSEAGCFASSAYLSRILGTKPRQLRNLLSLLERLRYIERRQTKRGWRVIQTATSKALGTIQATPKDRQWIATGGGNGLPPYRIEDKQYIPPNPLKRGKRVRKVKLTGKEYGNGF